MLAKVMQSLEYSRRRTLPYTSEGVMFKNGQKVTKFYNKEKERMYEKDFEGAQAAQGILRQETGVRKKAIKKLVGKNEPTLRDVNVNLLIDILENDLQELGLLGHSIGIVDTTSSN